MTQKRAWGEGNGRVGLISRSLLGAMVTEGMAYLLYFTRLLQGGQFWGKLDHLQSIMPLLFPNCFKLYTFILGSHF